MNRQKGRYTIVERMVTIANIVNFKLNRAPTEAAKDLFTDISGRAANKTPDGQINLQKYGLLIPYLSCKVKGRINTKTAKIKNFKYLRTAAAFFGTLNLGIGILSSKS